MKVKLRGVYDFKLFSYLQKIEVNHFAFDLRPASFNFTPMKTIVEMLKSAKAKETSYSFLFGNEKDFVIDQLMFFARKHSLLNKENSFLEFTDSDNIDFCDKFESPYIWHFKESVDYRKIQKAKYLSGISFSYQYLEELRESNQLYPFIKEFMSLKKNDQWIDLRLDWSDHLSESVIDFLPANTFSYEINQKVEKSYRDVNLNLISSHLEHARRILDPSRKTGAIL